MSSERLRAERLQKLEALRRLGVDPYGGRVEVTAEIAKVREMCPASEAEKPPAVTIAGRVMAIRDMGKSKWLDLVDRS
ncbi:MAG: lysine--tRNA ligase, partial [Planctomycetota bacterium]|nr:lysine--tRNA ligase [Planctomycetota bacterium]